MAEKEKSQAIMEEKRRINEAKKNGTYVEPKVEKKFDTSYLQQFDYGDEEEEKQPAEEEKKQEEQIKPKKGKG